MKKIIGNSLNVKMAAKIKYSLTAALYFDDPETKEIVMASAAVVNLQTDEIVESACWFPNQSMDSATDEIIKLAVKYGASISFVDEPCLREKCTNCCDVNCGNAKCNGYMIRTMRTKNNATYN